MPKNTLVLGVDTMGVFQNHILGKPESDEDAKRMLRLLSNNTHKVISALCLIDPSTPEEQAPKTAICTTLVTMDELSEEQIATYVSSGEGRDKAAAYAIQGLGALLVKEIKGDYNNVVGLPLHTLLMMLGKK